MRTSLPSANTLRAFTLVELLVALTLSLILLIGVIELFGRVSQVMSETRSKLNLSANLDGVERLLRQDLERIPHTLSDKPKRIADPNVDEVSDLDGYLEIVEGPNSISYVNKDGEPDPTVGDIDDIIAFTAKADAAMPFRGWIDRKIAERNFAEIVWFVRGNTLYRRVRLVDDQNILNDPNVNTMQDLARRERRFGHDGPANPFPHPLYNNANDGWYHLRMPTLEETLHKDWSANNWRTASGVPTVLTGTTADLWEQPHFFPVSPKYRPEDQDKEKLLNNKSGSLNAYVDYSRHHRAGEDVVLTNVLSFDIKVWDPRDKDFVDLGTGTTWGSSNQSDLPRTWDSWTLTYKKPGGTEIELPPYTEPLGAIQITIRCFDPASRIIKQISVIHRFKN